MFAKSILVYGLNFVSVNLIDKLCNFSHYRIAIADICKNDYFYYINNKVLFEKVNDKLQIVNKYQFDIVIEFVNVSLVKIFLKQKFDKPDIIVNISECYGPKQNENEIIPKLILSSFNEDYLHIDTSIERSLIYIDDVCFALLKIIHFGNVGSEYNVLTDQKYKDLDIARLILKKMQLPMTLIEYIESNNVILGSISDNMSIKKLGWSPKISIDAGIDSTIKWFREKYD